MKYYIESSHNRISYIMNVIQKGIKVNQKYNDAEQYAKKI